MPRARRARLRSISGKVSLPLILDMICDLERAGRLLLRRVPFAIFLLNTRSFDPIPKRTLSRTGLS